MSPENSKSIERWQSDLLSLKAIIDSRIGEVREIENAGEARGMIGSLVHIYKNAEGHYGVSAYSGTAEVSDRYSYISVNFTESISPDIEAVVGWASTNYDSKPEWQAVIVDSKSYTALVGNLLNTVLFEIDLETRNAEDRAAAETSEDD